MNKFAIDTGMGSYTYTSMAIDTVRHFIYPCVTYGASSTVMQVGYSVQNNATSQQLRGVGWQAYFSAMAPSTDLDGNVFMVWIYNGEYRLQRMGTGSKTLGNVTTLLSDDCFANNGRSAAMAFDETLGIVMFVSPYSSPGHVCYARVRFAGTLSAKTDAELLCQSPLVASLAPLNSMYSASGANFCLNDCSGVIWVTNFVIRVTSLIVFVCG